MSLAILSLALIPLQYTFEPESKVQYNSEITFEGFIPILGGNEGTVVVKMGVEVEGLEPAEKAELQAASDITSFSVTFDGIQLPFDLDSVQEVFPRNKIELTSQGKIVASDAPDKKLPVRLPGLDVKRFPDITYVPVQFPKGGAKVGDKWEFEKLFGESNIYYNCSLKSINKGIAKITLKIKQEYEVLENAALEVVTEKEDAEYRTKTVMTGTGHVLFDTEQGLTIEVLMINDSTTDVVSIADGKESTRELKTTFSLKIIEETEVREELKPEGWMNQVWEAVKTHSATLSATALEWWSALKLAFKLASKQVGPAGG